MGSASKLFYLAVFSLLSPSYGDSHASKPRAHSPSACAIEPKATVSDTCTSFSTMNRLNDEIAPLLNSLTRDSDFFSYYRLNLFNKQCPFWSDEEGMCGNSACAVNTLDSEEDIPPIWRSEELSKLEGPKAGHPGKKQQLERPSQKPLQGMLGEDVGETCVVEYDDECDERDYCVPEDEGATAKGDYVSLIDNPERYTGYSGAGARQVWDAIYRENCFLKPSQQSKAPKNVFGMSGQQAAQDFRNVLEKHERDQVVQAAVRKEGYPLDDECLEKRVFHRLVSGMHASISTHLCWDYLNQTTGKWEPNLQCYDERLHKYPERISNLYFNFAVLVRAVAKLQRSLQHYVFCFNDEEQNYQTHQKLSKLTDKLVSKPHVFNETIMFQDDITNGLREDFRNRFRNVSRLMDCIGCDKCRLWGKLQTAGYGTALKVLFEFDRPGNGANPPLRRTELVALVNTLGRISHSITSVQKFEEALISGKKGGLSAHGSIPISSSESSGHSKQESSPTSSKKGDNDPYVDGHDDTEKEYFKRKESADSESLVDTFWEEFDLVWRAYVYVFKSWARLPSTLYHIAIMELNRLWSYWLGLPVPPRSWKIHYPSRDEL